jgi:hypothetical protein
MLAQALKVAPHYADAMFNSRAVTATKNKYVEAADYWGQSRQRSSIGMDCSGATFIEIL